MDNSYKNIFNVGFVGNAVECIIQQPIYGYKNLKQIDVKLEKFRHLYRGLLGNIFTQSSLVISQMCGYKYFVEKTECGDLGKLGISSSLGFITGTLFTPLELWSIRKQQKLKWLHDHKLYRGCWHMGLRESCYSAGLLTIMPMISKWTQEIYGFKNEIFSSLVAGSISGFLSHPFDTIKCYNQSQITNNYTKIKYNPLNRVLYKGLLFRMYRISGSYFILDYCNRKIFDMVEEPSEK